MKNISLFFHRARYEKQFVEDKCVLPYRELNLMRLQQIHTKPIKQLLH